MKKKSEYSDGSWGSVLIERFWKYVDKRSQKECWLWIGSKTVRGGYGQLHNKGVLLKSHRISYELHHGKIDSSQHVLHRCNIPSCVNPSHLYLGTNLENTADRIKAGTQYYIPPLKGEKSPHAKLTEKQAKFILDSNMRGVDLASRFGVSKAAISCIKKRKNWKHL